MWSSKRKTDVVLRLLRGEDLDALFRELCVKTSTLAKWRDDFHAGGEAGLAVRRVDGREVELPFEQISRARVVYEFTREDFAAKAGR